MIQVKLPDGSVKDFPAGVRPREVAESIGKRLAAAAVAAVADGTVVDLDRPLEDGKAAPIELKLLTPRDREALDVLRHSTAHVMARAVMRLFSGVRLAFGPTTATGFYYDMTIPGRSLSEDDFPAIEAEMAKVVKDAEPFERFHLPVADARAFCAELDQDLKVEHIDEELSQPKYGGVLSFYRQGEFVDLCRGPHIPHAGKVGAFKLLSVAGSYWKGRTDGPVLQRLYGTAFFDKKELDAHLAQIEEAKKRDHRRLGKELGLFTISQLVGSGLILWMPKGATVRGVLEEFLKHELIKRGYQPVYTPHIGNIKLYETSGHYPYYKDSQFPPIYSHPLVPRVILFSELLTGLTLDILGDQVEHLVTKLLALLKATQIAGDVKLKLRSVEAEVTEHQAKAGEVPSLSERVRVLVQKFEGFRASKDNARLEPAYVELRKEYDDIMAEVSRRKEWNQVLERLRENLEEVGEKLSGDEPPELEQRGTFERSEQAFLAEVVRHSDFPLAEYRGLQKKELRSEVKAKFALLEDWLAKQEQYLLKPMNCPHHIQIYAAQPRSYKDLPIRLAEFGTVYRYEQSGELSGLTRVRGFTQDDAHLFCTEEQVRGEFRATMELTQHVLTTGLGLSDYKVRLSASDPDDPKYAGAAGDTWRRAEADIRAVLDEMGLPYEVALGEAAFYGPKADFLVRDCLGRQWQLGTVQLDYVLPERFGLEYVGADNKPHRPVMIHRAPFGSMERFMGILIEHFAGAFPLWLAPEQVRVLPISEKVADYADKVLKQLQSAGLRASADLRPEKIGAKIRDAQLEKIPVMLVVGPKEADAGLVAYRDRLDGDKGTMPLDQAVAQLKAESESRAIRQVVEPLGNEDEKELGGEQHEY